jgi:hypothetical protein
MVNTIALSPPPSDPEALDDFLEQRLLTTPGVEPTAAPGEPEE